MGPGRLPPVGAVIIARRQLVENVPHWALEEAESAVADQRLRDVLSQCRLGKQRLSLSSHDVFGWEKIALGASICLEDIWEEGGRYMSRKSVGIQTSQRSFRYGLVQETVIDRAPIPYRYRTSIEYRLVMLSDILSTWHSQLRSIASPSPSSLLAEASSLLAEASPYQQPCGHWTVTGNA